MRYTGLLVSLLVASGCERTVHHAEYAIPGSGLVLAIDLRPSHPFLAEYDRTLSLGATAATQQTTELFGDSGGYALVNLYRVGPSLLLVKTMGNDDYFLDVEKGIVTRESIHPAPPGTEFVGAFDFAPSWRFVPTSEREERRIGEIYHDDQP